jgi:hypothetical protein
MDLNRQGTKSANDAEQTARLVRSEPSAELDRLAHLVIGPAIEVDLARLKDGIKRIISS